MLGRPAGGREVDVAAAERVGEGIDVGVVEGFASVAALGAGVGMTGMGG